VVDVWEGEGDLSAIYNQALFHWQDQNGNTAVSFLTIQDQATGVPGDILALAADVQACCEASIVAVQVQYTHHLTRTPTTGPYKTVWDRGVLIGRNATTSQSQRTVLVGPKAGIFLPGNVQVDMTLGSIVTVQSQVQAVLGNSVGDPCGPFQRGVRQKANAS
jgi:hypothetical protein